MLKIAICEDNQIDLSILENFLIEYFNINNIENSLYLFSSGEDFLSSYKNGMYDLVFLDIFMKGINGIEVGKYLRKHDTEVSIIFCTSSTEYALESYELLAYGYMVKPFDVKKLTILMNHFIEAQPTNIMKKIMVKSNHSDVVIYLNDIEYVESSDKILTIHTINGELIKTYGKLNDLEKQIASPTFLRCHQSYIVNLDYVTDLSETDFITKSNVLIPIRKKEHRQMISSYIEYKKNFVRNRII